MVITLKLWIVKKTKLSSEYRNPSAETQFATYHYKKRYYVCQVSRLTSKYPAGQRIANRPDSNELRWTMDGFFSGPRYFWIVQCCHQV